MISIVIPVKNGGEDLRRCLAAIAAQQVPDDVEVIVVDSGSADDSVTVARGTGARVHQIAPADFDHGATRNLGVSLARGEIIVFISQDAYPERPDWLARLTAPLADPAIGGAYGRQVAHHDAAPSEGFFLDFLYGSQPRVQRAGGPADLTMDVTLFSNANAAMRRETLVEFPFAQDIIMSEDQEWSRRVLLAGRDLAYVADAVVRHSHPYTLAQAFRRFFDSGVSSERAYMAGRERAEAVLRRRSLDYALGELRWLWRSGHRLEIPYAILYEAVKWLGLQLGMRHRGLPRRLVLRCTALPSWWVRHG